MIYRLNRNRAL